MFSLILAVLKRDDTRGYYNPFERAVFGGASSISGVSGIRGTFLGSFLTGIRLFGVLSKRGSHQKGASTGGTSQTQVLAGSGGGGNFQAWPLIPPPPAFPF